MKKPLRLRLFQLFPLLLIPLLLVVTTGCRTFASDESKPLTIASYNLRYASATGPNSWPERRPLIREVIHSINPDLIGTQEGLHHQLKDIAEDLPGYDWIGVGREGGTRSEFMAVFYRKARLQPLSTNHFWLSDTPEVVGSTTWGNSNRRMVTWIQFRDRETGKEFYFFNTHFDHQVQAAREKSANLVRERVGALGAKLPVILVGDFNSNAEANKAYDILTADNFFSDSWLKTTNRKGEGLGTFNGFQEVPRHGGRIDWILTRGNVKVEAASIEDLQPNGQWASDHFPVTATLVME